MGKFSELDRELRETELWRDVIDMGGVPKNICIYAQGRYSKAIESIKEMLLEWDIPQAEIESAMPFIRESIEQLFNYEPPELPRYNDVGYLNEERFHFIWGISPNDRLTPTDLNIYSETDIDIVYDSVEEKYLLGIDTLYDSDCPQKYIMRMLNLMTAWMDEKGYDKSYKPDIYDVFIKFLCSGTGFDSIEQTYGCFKFLAEKFCEGLPSEKEEAI